MSSPAVNAVLSLLLLVLGCQLCLAASISELYRMDDDAHNCTENGLQDCGLGCCEEDDTCISFLWFFHFCVARPGIVDVYDPQRLVLGIDFNITYSGLRPERNLTQLLS